MTIPATCYFIQFNKVKISLKLKFLLKDGLFFKDNNNHLVTNLFCKLDSWL